jgi:hypothetical protein
LLYELQVIERTLPEIWLPLVSATNAVLMRPALPAPLP